MAINMKPLANEEPFSDFDSVKTLKIVSDGGAVNLQAEGEENSFVTIETYTDPLTVKSIELHNGQRWRVQLPNANCKAYLSYN